MNCNHEIDHLMGTADGVVCRCCGKLFPDMAAVIADRYPDKEAPAAAPEKPKRATRKKKEGT